MLRSDAANPMAAWSVISAMGRAGDEHAEAVIRDFLDRGHARLVRAVTAMTGERESAQDLVQEAVVRAWERIARGEDIRSVDGWIATAALNLARTSLRRRTVRTRVERRLTDSLHAAAQQRAGVGDGVANTSVVTAALRELPWRQRQVTVMRYFLGMDVGEIADQLGISDGTVKAALFRARAVLRPLLADAFDQTQEEVQRGR
jgi:RNA polymerase sigma-70 factor, ECF subfamily